MDDKKLIIPAEVKVCATCSYWDGERRVDQEVGVVVVTDSCHGECLVKGKERQGLHDTRVEHECMWEGLWADEAPVADAPSDGSAEGRVHLDTDASDAGPACRLPGAAPA